MNPVYSKANVFNFWKEGCFMLKFLYLFSFIQFFCHVSFIRKYVMYTSFWSQILRRIHFSSFLNTKIRQKSELLKWREGMRGGVGTTFLQFTLPLTLLIHLDNPGCGQNKVWWHVLSCPYSMNKFPWRTSLLHTSIRCSHYLYVIAQAT